MEVLAIRRAGKCDKPAGTFQLLLSHLDAKIIQMGNEHFSSTPHACQPFDGLLEICMGVIAIGPWCLLAIFSETRS